ncbi:MAG: helix-turn-helix transcriptional regulator [Fibrobacteres bacterium]|nr:helix-turn-helix transcriptional regulator [Fibrobacterota bacterium]
MYIHIMEKEAEPALIGVHIKTCNFRKNYQTLYNNSRETILENNFVLLFVLDGLCEVEVDNKKLLLQKGGIAIWQPGNSVIMRSRADNYPTYYLLGFEAYTNYGLCRTVNELGFDHFFDVQNYNKAVKLVNTINKIYHSRSQNLLTEAAIASLNFFRSLKMRPLVFVPFQDRPDNRNASEKMDSVISFIHKNYKKKIPLKKLAEISSLHVINFVKVFKEVTGLSPHQYIIQRKIDKAKDFIRLYQDFPTNVSQELGFHDYSHFCRTFKRIVGVTPKDFRKR